MQNNQLILGIDTSNYKTSVAITDKNGIIISDCRKTLTVKPGEKGLRQSEAFFQHINNLPALIEMAIKNCDGKNISAVSVSARPRPIEGSYMPVFKAGESIGRSIAAALRVNLFEFSHQEGHIKAVQYYSKFKHEKKLLCFHLSGGTCELLKVENDVIQIIGGSKDISFGQLLDRIGVGLGCQFPAGEELDKLARIEKPSHILKKIEMDGLWFNLSGMETKALRNLETPGLIPELFEKISDLLVQATEEAVIQTKIENVLFTGGVAESLTLRDMINHKLKSKVVFGDKDLSSDNGVGVSLLGGNALWL